MKNCKNTFKAVILAGGSGERFWPLSTPERPKQFLSIFGSESLIRQSVFRLGDLIKSQDVYIVTSKKLVNATRKELPELPKGNIIGEPHRRDTLAAVALGVAIAGAEDDPVIGFFPSDNMIAKPGKFRSAVRRAIALANRKKTIVTIGIKPTYPSVSFGYINKSNGQFIEKPNIKKAKQYVSAGYLWNAGMFFARASVFREAIKVFAPNAFELTSGSLRSRKMSSFYENLEKKSFDYAVLEKIPASAKKTNKAITISVVLGDFGWDDVGSFAAFDSYFPHDSFGNVREGPCTPVDSRDNICVARGARVSLLGVKNLVIITTAKSVFVADKTRLSEMKKLFK